MSITGLNNPWHMHCRGNYSSRSVSVCLSVTMLAATYLFYTSQMKFHRVLRRFQDFSRVAFAENALTIVAFLASWRALDGQKRQQWLLFNKTRV